MADGDERADSASQDDFSLGDVPADLIAQVRGALERLSSVAEQIPGVSQIVSNLPEVPTIPAPGGLSATQVAAIMATVRAQRSTIGSLKVSLDAFEQQLDVLEQLLEPMQTITEAWARFERRSRGE